MNWVDPLGNKIGVMEWAVLFEDYPKRVFDSDPIPNGKYLRTIWTGEIDHQMDLRPWSTIIAGANYGFIAVVEHYDSKTDALAGHQRHLERLRGAA